MLATSRHDSESPSSLSSSDWSRDDTFCYLVSEAFALGFEAHGGPTISATRIYFKDEAYLHERTSSTRPHGSSEVRHPVLLIVVTSGFETPVACVRPFNRLVDEHTLDSA